jgi:hypothetical protein
VWERERKNKTERTYNFRLVEERKSGQLEGKRGENALEGRRETERERKRRSWVIATEESRKSVT